MSDNVIKTPPYNPWESYLVEASAGSGKTWQLSRRFLALVVAGADPASILTVTFTKKAAAEMRERIVKDAVRLGAGADDFAGFTADIELWRQNSGSKTHSKIRTPQEASQLIIQKTQTLKITTIDALFLQWSQRFPLETAITIGEDTLTSPWDLLSNLALTRLNTDAWCDVLAIAEDHDANRELMISISENAPNGKIKSLSEAIDPLTKSETFIWYIQMLGRELPLRLFNVPETLETGAEFLARNESLARVVLNLIGNEDKKSQSLSCLMSRDFQGLVDAKVINGGRDALSGVTFAKAKKTENTDFLEFGRQLRSWNDNIKLADLNHTARLIWTLFEARTSAAHKRKVRESMGTFSDASKGVSILACDEKTSGGRAMAWASVRHLMLDEFQDTSRLQWMIFEKLSQELLSGQTYDAEGGPRPSVFIVGDKKQSIYRFREAAPEVLDLARDTLAKQGLLPVTMSDSFRSSSLVLDLVNEVFSDGTQISKFPAHQPSPYVLKSKPVKSSYGTLTVYKASEAIENDDQSKVSAVDVEAQLVARHIKDRLDGVKPMRVYDEHTATWRAPRCSDFAVLYPNTTNSQAFEDAMRELSIPSRRAESKGFFGRPEILDLNSLVTWLTWPADTVALCTVLRSPICGVNDSDLQSVIANNKSMPMMNALKTAATKSLKDSFTLLKDLRKNHHSESMAELVGRLLTHYAVAERYLNAFGPMEGPLARANVLKWFDLVRGQSAEDALAAHTWSQAMEEAAEEDETGNATLASNAVTMMTIHKSKGLEFPCVILTGTAKDWHRAETAWIKDTRPGHEGLCYIGNKGSRPESSPQIRELLQLSEAESRGEKARLLYVALTRASQHLVVTGAKAKEDSENYLDLILGAAERLNDVNRDLSSETTITITRDTHPEISPLAAKSSRLTDTKGALVSPLNLPPVKILTPSAKATSQDTKSPAVIATQRVPEGLGNTFGSLVHKMFELHVGKIQWSDRKFSRFITEITDHLVSNAETQDLLTLAKSDVAAVLASKEWSDLTASVAQIWAEVPMASVDGGDLVNAKADLIIKYSDGNIRVVDFKTIPVSPGDAKTVCDNHGYTEQVQTYCRLAMKVYKVPAVTGSVLFTNPIHLLNL